MTNQEFDAISKRIDDLSHALNGRMDHISESMHKEIVKVTVQMAEIVTVVKRSLDQQDTTNRHVEQIAANLEKRTREIEYWRAGVDARMPEELVAAEYIRGKFRELAKADRDNENAIRAADEANVKRIEALRVLLTDIRLWMARWGGIIVVGSIVGGVALQLLVRWLGVVIFGA